MCFAFRFFFSSFFFFFFLSTQPRPIETRDQPSVAPTAPLKNNDFRIYCVLISSLLSPSLLSFSPLPLPRLFISSRGSQSNACARQTLCAFSFFFFFSLLFFLLTLPLSRITSPLRPPPSPLNENESLFARRRFFSLPPRSLFSFHLFPKRHFEAYYSINLHLPPPPRNFTWLERKFKLKIFKF